MRYESLIKVLFILSVMCVNMYTYAAPFVPQSDLMWKNVNVHNRKVAVFSIFKDSDGLIWIGGKNGLSYYDGIATHSVGSDTLKGTQVYSIVEHDEKLLLGTNNGLFCLDPLSGEVSHDDGVADREIRTMMLNGDRLWIGGIDGITIYNLKHGDSSHIDKGLPHKSVYALMKDSRGLIYAGTYTGPARWDESTKSFHPLHVEIDGKRKQPFLANCIIESDDLGSLYFGGEGVLLRYHLASNLWEEVKVAGNANVKSLAKSDDGHILLGTDEGVLDYDPNGTTSRHLHDTRKESSIADNEIWCLYRDDANNLWAGHERGFSIASSSSITRPVKLSRLTNSGDGNDIYIIHRDRSGKLWLAGSNGIICMGNGSDTRWYRHSETKGALSHKRIRAIYESADGTMWFATDAGINRFDSVKNGFDIYRFTDDKGGHNSNWVYALGETDGRFWCGGFLSGVHLTDRRRIEPGGGTIVADMSLNERNSVLTNDLINNAVTDLNGNLWILLFRDRYVNHYNIRNNKFERIDIHKLTGEYPVGLSIDHRGRVWCAFNGGMAVFNGTTSPKIVDYTPTSDDEAILAMAPVDDDMWISTTNNVWKIDGTSLESHILPIPQKSYTSIYDDVATNNVILGGNDELMVINKDSFVLAPDLQTIKKAVVRIGDDAYMTDVTGRKNEGIKIPYGGTMSISISTLDYTPGAAQRYRYRLAKSATDSVGNWINLAEGTNSITLSNLSMGNHVLLVRAAGPASPVMAIPIHVEAPLWLSWWAIAIYVIICLGGAYGFIVYLRRRNERLFNEKERQTVLENTERKLTFLSMISHDLKTPLSMILGPVSLLKEQTTDEITKKTLETVYDNAVRLNNMIHRTLELQRIEDIDENLLILSTFDAVEFCKGIFKVFKDNHPQKKFLFYSSTIHQLIEADAVKFESIITNLLSNACKYSHDGSTVSLGINSDAQHIEIIVSDDGMGISEDDQNLVFQRMFRSPTTARQKEGTGLGLYLIRKYLELMHGDISLYSQEGQGTSFTVTLPVADREKPLQAVKEDDDTRPGILIVEDNLQISEFISSVLSSQYHCETAENGSSGLAIAASMSPDLIIADEMMPVMTGIEMVRQLKRNPRLAAIPIIMLTAKSDNQTENESIKLGVDVFMTKPFEPSVLSNRVAQLLKARREISEKMRINAIAEAGSKPIEAESANEKSLARIAKVIEENLSDTNLNVSMLCEKTGIPNKQLYRLVKKYMDTSPVDYIRSVRLQKAAVLLSQHRFTVAEVAYMVGFNSPSYFTKCFQNQFGVRPSEYRSDDEKQ